MPLVPVNTPAAYRGAEVTFSMQDPDNLGQGLLTVTVTMGALDGLAPSGLNGKLLAEWVDRHRREFEAIATDKYAQGQTLRITANDWIARFPMPS